MFLLDNDAFQLLITGDEATIAYVAQNEGQVFLSSVAAEEHIAPYLNAINRARAPRTSLSLPRAHADFTEAISDLNTLPIWAYDEQADAIYKMFPASVIRVGSQDCRIAAQAMAHDLIVVTRNLRDFEAIGAPCTDWSV